MYPNCAGGNCEYYGISKLVDGKESGTRTLGHTSYGTSPYMQLDLGYPRSDVLAVRLVARSDTALYQSQYLNVYMSNTTSFQGTNGTLCEANVTFDFLGEDTLAMCPVNVTARYITVWKNATSYLALQEVQPLVDGEWLGW